MDPVKIPPPPYTTPIAPVITVDTPFPHHFKDGEIHTPGLWPNFWCIQIISRIDYAIKMQATRLCLHYTQGIKVIEVTQYAFQPMSLLQPSAQQWLKHMYLTNNIGSHISKQGSLIDTLAVYPVHLPWQVYMAGQRSYALPKTGGKNPSAANFVLEKGYTLFTHGPVNIQLAWAPDFRGDKGTGNTVPELLIQHTEYSASQGSRGVVFHVGKPSTRYSKEEGLENMRNNIRLTLEALAACTTEFPVPPRLILETPAGQGTELIANLDDWMAFVAPFIQNYPLNFGTCLDTAHVFGCGYYPADYLSILVQHQLTPVLIHFNDSRKKLHSCRDAHTLPGMGHINPYDLWQVSQVARVMNIPVVGEHAPIGVIFQYFDCLETLGHLSSICQNVNL